MKLEIANPIYDVVFKYMMEDEKSAKIILSTLLKKNVSKVSIRRQEYTNPSKSRLSMFRIDFSATITDEGGNEQVVLIELQKAWLESEILRFRRYIASQYMDEDNMRESDTHNVHALPMISVYLLGHSIGEISEPVLYINHKAYNYEGMIVEHALSNRFIESLTHDTIILQIPQLSKVEEPSNRLEKVFSIFNQKNVKRGDKNLVLIDEESYEGDEEMQHLIHRLELAGMDINLRRQVNVEDEFFTAINNRDKKLKLLDKLISEKESQLSQKDEQLTQKDEQLSKKDEQLNQKDELLSHLIKLSLSKGLSINEIASSLGLTEGDVEKLSKV